MMTMITRAGKLDRRSFLKAVGLAVVGFTINPRITNALAMHVPYTVHKFGFPLAFPMAFISKHDKIVPLDKPAGTSVYLPLVGGEGK